LSNTLFKRTAYIKYLTRLRVWLPPSTLWYFFFNFHMLHLMWLFMLDMNVIKAKFIKYLIKEGQKKLKSNKCDNIDFVVQSKPSDQICTIIISKGSKV